MSDFMQYFGRTFRAVPYVVGLSLAALLLYACGGRATPTPTPGNAPRTYTSSADYNCSRSPYPDFVGRITDVVDKKIEGIGAGPVPRLVLSRPSNEKVVDVKLTTSRPMSLNEVQEMAEEVRGICP